MFADAVYTMDVFFYLWIPKSYSARQNAIVQVHIFLFKK